MRADYRLPTGDWGTRDSLAEMTEVYDRTQPTEFLDAVDVLPIEGSAPLVLPVEPMRLPQATQPVVVAPIAYVPMQRYEVPTIAPYAMGASPQIRVSERLDATHRVERAPSWHGTLLAAGIVAAIAIGVSVGIAVSSGGSELEPPPVKVAERVSRPAPSRPIVTPIVTPIEQPKPAAKSAALVDVRVESNPAGAEATLIDGDKATPLGATPLAVSLDPGRTYDVMIALAGHATKVAHVTPSASQRVVVAFDDTGRHTVRRARSGR